MKISALQLGAAVLTCGGCLAANVIAFSLTHTNLEFSLNLTLMLFAAGFGGWCLLELRKYK